MLITLQVGASDTDKALIANQILEELFLQRMKVPYEKINTDFRNQTFEHIYKFRLVFKGDIDPRLASFASAHSILANLVLDYPALKDEDILITNLRENYKKIIEFSKDDSNNVLEIINCDVIYQKYYKEMLKHILVSDKNLPSNINLSTLRKIGKDCTYSINKKIMGR